MSIRNKAKTAAIIVTVLLMASVMFMAVQVQPVEAQSLLLTNQSVDPNQPAPLLIYRLPLFPTLASDLIP